MSQSEHLQASNLNKVQFLFPRTFLERDASVAQRHQWSTVRERLVCVLLSVNPAPAAQLGRANFSGRCGFSSNAPSIFLFFCFLSPCSVHDARCVVRWRWLLAAVVVVGGGASSQRVAPVQQQLQMLLISAGRGALNLKAK